MAVTVEIRKLNVHVGLPDLQGVDVQQVLAVAAKAGADLVSSLGSAADTGGDDGETVEVEGSESAD